MPGKKRTTPVGYYKRKTVSTTLEVTPPMPFVNVVELLQVVCEYQEPQELYKSKLGNCQFAGFYKQIPGYNVEHMDSNRVIFWLGVEVSFNNY